jgi:peptide/nickel transport system ATP-binding protein
MPDYVPPTRDYREVSPGHIVQTPGAEWAAA